jgi:5'-nucleotidase
MNPYLIIKKAGFDILFTGIITEKILDSLKQDSLIGTFVTLQEASNEVGKICNAYKNDDIDLTILLTHIGFESDIELAKMIRTEWGVDMIIGGHSHTVLEQPEKVNKILIAQAGVGTNQIGRFDIEVDDDTNSIVNYKWELIEINDKIAEPDRDLQEFICSFQADVDQKYGAMICKFKKKLTHPEREIETTLGNLIADAFAQNAQCDLMLLGSGSVRVEELGPVVTLNDLISCFPYDDTLTRYTVTGKDLLNIFSHIMRIENRDGEGECYQVNERVKAVYDDKKKKLESLSIDEKPVKEKELYTICLQGFHFNNCKDYLNISQEELLKAGESKVVTTSAQEVLEEFLRNNQLITREIEGRLVYK